MKWNQIRQSSVSLMLVILFSKFIGIFRDIVLAKYFGTSSVSDAYLIASTVPVLLFYFIGHSLSTAYIPMYNKVKFEKSKGQALYFSNNILNFSLILSAIIVVVLLFFPDFIVKIFAAGFDEQTASLSARLIKISAFSIFFMSIVHICGGYLQANRSFLAPAAISLPRNLAIVISVVLASSYGLDILGWGLLFAYFLEFIFLLPFVIKNGYKYSFVLDSKDENLKETLYIILPILLGLCVSQVNKIIDRSIASTITVGAVSALSYASILNNAVQEILVTGIITILFSSCAQLVAQGKHEVVIQKLGSTIKILIFFLIPASIGIVILSEPIVRLVLCRGNFNVESLNMTSAALSYYTIGLLFLAIRDTLIKVFYAYKETKITTTTSVFAIVINIILNIVLSKFLGIKGLALATSISAIFHCGILYIALHNKIGDFDHKHNLIILFKCLFAGLVMSVLVKNLFPFLQLRYSPSLALFLSIFAGVVIYLGCCYFLKCRVITNQFHNRL